MSLERQLDKIKDRDELILFVKDLPEDSYGVLIATSLEDRPDGLCIHGFGECRLSALLGLAIWGQRYIEKMLPGPESTQDEE